VAEYVTISEQIAAITSYNVSDSETMTLEISQDGRKYWELIDDSQSITWQNVDNSESTTWTVISTV